MLELAFVAGSVCPGQLSLSFPNSILPVSVVFDAIRPLHLPSSVHSVLKPLPAVHPALFCALEGSLALLHAMLEAPRVAVAVGPGARALAVEHALLQATDVFLARWPRHLTFAPHLVLAPLSVVCAASGPRLLPVAPHVALVELAEELAAIAPNVVALPVHSATQPGSYVRVAIGENSLVLHESICGELVAIRLSGRDNTKV
mmetsp:Transcript_77251/g.185007  ORF Transcript_77251/g.185007 Transcript_77251/m.185007 type:complete len:202 (+) Transcript_77251:1529-2134(+)